MGYFNEEAVIDAQKFTINAKASIQKNGRLGFSNEAATLLSLDEGKYLLFSCINSGDLAAIVCDNTDVRGFKVQKGGKYFYIRMKNFFDAQDIDYVKKRVSFEIIETTEEYKGKTVFRFKRGIFARKSNDDVDFGEKE